MVCKFLYEKYNYLDSVSFFGCKLWVKLFVSFLYKIVVFEIYLLKYVLSICIICIINFF